MKRLMVGIALVLCFAFMAPATLAQLSGDNDSNKNLGEFGVYVDFTKLQFAKLKMLGVGGRIGFNINPAIAIEGDLAYDLPQSVSQSTTTLGVTTTVGANIRLIHGLFGAKIHTTGKSVQVFGVLKGGILNFGLSGTNGAALNQIGAIKDGDSKPVFYPGGGVEFKIRRVWIRIEGGDEIFWDNGPNHNLKIMAGPQIHF